jgi:hypothetical protein
VHGVAEVETRSTLGSLLALSPEILSVAVFFILFHFLVGRRFF